MKKLQMVDLRSQYEAIRKEIDTAIQRVIENSSFIRGPEGTAFESELSGYLDGHHVISVGNGTDALQVAFMALDLKPGDEVITPSFTFVATGEAAALLGAVPVFADIDQDTFTIDPTSIEELITDRTRAIVPVHLFGQTCDMDPIMNIAERHDLAVIEDTAQAIGAHYKGHHAGCIGSMGTFSFFPSKNLGAYGDAGAVVTSDPVFHDRVRLISNHGSKRKYENEIVGVNSRLDGMQAAILRVKLGYLESYTSARIEAADRYDELLADIPHVSVPKRHVDGRHVFHQYTIRISSDWVNGRSGLIEHLKTDGIPHAVYYPIPLHRLPVFESGQHKSRSGSMIHTDKAADEVLSLPMHTELDADQQEYIAGSIRTFITQNG